MIRALFERRETCSDCGARCGTLRPCACSLASACKAGALVSLLVMWAMAGRLIASRPDGGVAQDEVWISLPVYITSLLATAVFVWKLAKYDSVQAQRMRDLERSNAEAQALAAGRVQALHDENTRRFTRLEEAQAAILEQLAGGHPADP